jgi:DNA-binding transcriptional LysR family regulator
MVTSGGAAELLDARLLLLFTLLYSTKSVSRAAEELGQSQPNVSVWLNKLRAHFDDPLFVRTARGMEPTPRAESLVEPVREALQSLRRVSEPARAFVPGEARRSFRICMTDGSHITLLPRLLKHLRDAAPHIRIEAAPIGDGTARDLETGNADLALGIVPGLESGFYQQAFYDQDFICLVSPRHSVIGSGLTLKRYRESAHVEVLSGKSHSLLVSALKEQGVERDVLLQLPGFLGLATVVAETDLVATVPREIGETLARNGGPKVLKCPVKVPTFSVKQYWHVRMHHDEANRWLRSICASIYTKQLRAL